MPLPELQTQGPDFTNTLLKIEQLKNSKLQREHLIAQNALLNAKASPEVQNLLLQRVQEEVAAKRAANAKDALEQEKEQLGIIQGHISTIQPTEEDYTKAKNWLQANKNLKIRPDFLPDVETFMQEDISNPKTGKKFSEDLFKNWQRAVTQSAKDIHVDPSTGFEMATLYSPDGSKSIKVPVKKGMTFNPDNSGFPGWTFTAPKEKKEPIETWGKEEVLPSGERRQVSSRGKINVTVKAKEEKEDNVIAPVEQPDGTVIYTTRKNAIGKKVPGKKNDRDNVAKIVLNSAGEQVIILKSGKPKVYGFDDDGSVSLVDPKPEQLKGVEGIPRGSSQAEKDMAEMLKPESAKKIPRTFKNQKTGQTIDGYELNGKYYSNDGKELL